MDLADESHERRIVRVVTIKHPPQALEGMVADNSAIGKILDLPPHVAMLMIAAGWVRSETRSLLRRQEGSTLPFDRRDRSDRRSGH